MLGSTENNKNLENNMAKKNKANKAETTETTETKKSYPFASKREIVDGIMSNDDQAVQALVTIHTLEAAMCSHRKRVAALAARVAESENPTDDAGLVAECREVASHYGRRLARHARAQAVESNPDLAGFVETFSAKL